MLSSDCLAAATVVGMAYGWLGGVAQARGSRAILASLALLRRQVVSWEALAGPYPASCRVDHAAVRRLQEEQEGGDDDGVGSPSLVQIVSLTLLY